MTGVQTCALPISYPSSYSDRLAQEELGWIPSYSIKKGVKEHLETVIEENRKYKENINNEGKIKK